MENIAEAASCVVNASTEKHCKEEVFYVFTGPEEYCTLVF
jgi:hypothetical protein